MTLYEMLDRMTVEELIFWAQRQNKKPFENGWVQSEVIAMRLQDYKKHQKPKSGDVFPHLKQPRKRKTKQQTINELSRMAKADKELNWRQPEQSA